MIKVVRIGEHKKSQFKLMGDFKRVCLSACVGSCEANVKRGRSSQIQGRGSTHYQITLI